MSATPAEPRTPSSPTTDEAGPGGHGTFRTEPVSFIRRSGRLSTGQANALERSGSRLLLDLPRAIARTSVDPAFELDVAATYGR